MNSWQASGTIGSLTETDVSRVLGSCQAAFIPAGPTWPSFRLSRTVRPRLAPYTYASTCLERVSADHIKESLPVPEKVAPSDNAAPHPGRITKKQQIIALYLSGITNVEELARMTNTRPSYVGTTLQDAGLMHGYFDLYTSTAHPMNVYSKLFASQLGFKNEATAHHSVAVLEAWYRHFERAGDRAGQHHALSMALVMFDRARWMGKAREADLFRQWLVAQLGSESSARHCDTATSASRPDRGKSGP
jgi:hypothetical protein